MSRNRYVDPHAVAKCARGKLVVRSNEERDSRQGLSSRDGPTSLVTSKVTTMFAVPTRDERLTGTASVRNGPQYVA